MESPKLNNAEIQRECKVISEKIQSMHDRVSEMVVGRKARILSDTDGMSYRSDAKKYLRGEVFIIRAIAIDRMGCAVWDKDARHCYIPIDEVEFLED